MILGILQLARPGDRFLFFIRWKLLCQREYQEQRCRAGAGDLMIVVRAGNCFPHRFWNMFD